MTYVDLNPVRAGIADSVAASDFTSVQERLFEVARQQQSTTPKEASPKTNLLPFVESEHKTRNQAALPFNLQDYLDLVDWTGRVVREDKRGAIEADKPRLLEQLQMTEKQWMLLAIDIQLNHPAQPWRPGGSWRLDTSGYPIRHSLSPLEVVELSAELA